MIKPHPHDGINIVTETNIQVETTNEGHQDFAVGAPSTPRSDTDYTRRS
jgi:hypothetical protein